MRQHPRAGRRQPHHPPLRALRRPAAPAAGPRGLTRRRPRVRSGPVKVEIATTLTPAIVDAVERLVPQLSRSSPPPSTAELGELVSSPATDLFIAIDDDGTVVGMATLVNFRIPTGRRAWIEDVVVDEAGRGRGVGRALTDAMVDRARELGCRTVDLTSRPARQAAHRLYQRAGFEIRDTSVYRVDLRDSH
ncbi:MAG TPA: GNAT family N-acetyltransferase [Acidimicrobiales bacterium]